MKKLMIFAFVMLVMAGVARAKESGNFYVDSFVQTLTEQGAKADYDGQDVVLTVNDNDPQTEASIKAVGPDAMADMLKEQLVKNIAQFDGATKQLLGELANAGCGIKIRYLCGGQNVVARISPDELRAAV